MTSHILHGAVQSYPDDSINLPPWLLPISAPSSKKKINVQGAKSNHYGIYHPQRCLKRSILKVIKQCNPTSPVKPDIPSLPLPSLKFCGTPSLKLREVLRDIFLSFFFISCPTPCGHGERELSLFSAHKGGRENG